MEDEAHRLLPARNGSARAAREWAAAVLATWNVPSASAVALVLSELVTNALLHGGPPISVGLRRRPGAVWIGVTDGGRGQVEPRPPAAAAGGRGLGIVARASSSWGVSAAGCGTGKTVWAEVPDALRLF